MDDAAPGEMESPLDESAIRTFEEALQGDVIRPGGPDWDDARSVWNGMIDRQPALVARCVDADDVVAALRLVRERDLTLSVRGGGHNVAGYGTNDGGLVIDLSPMKSVRVDPDRHRVRAGGGATIADLDQATQEHGLAVPMGVVSQTGIAGLTLSGGIGWLRNAYGLSCDHLVEAEVVTADGEVVTADETENADLFWGLRGGGGNFGVVTDFTFRAHEVGPDVMFVFVLYHGSSRTEALRYYRAYLEDAPHAVSSFTICGTVPSDDDFPEEIHGEPYVLFAACHAGSVEEGKRTMQPLREFDDGRGGPLADFSGPMPFLEVQSILDADYPDGLRYYWKSLYLESLDDPVIEAIARHEERRPGPLSTVDVWPMRGMVRQPPGDGGAAGGRDAPFLLGVEANWRDPADDEANMAWTREVVKDMRRFSSGAEYLNFPGFHEGGSETMRSTFGDKYERLAELKRRYDPENLFRRTPNVEPAEET